MWSRPQAAMPIAAIIFILLAHALYYDYMVDDAFITFRYIRNMLAGNGLVYNPGERVEGYTNFLWAMLLALPAALGVRIELAAKIFGFFFGAATIAAVTVLAHRWVGEELTGRRRILIFLPGALLAASGPFAMWTVGGLETVFFTFLLVLATAVYFSSDRPRDLYGCGILLALLAMTRPDGVVFLAAVLAHIVFRGIGSADENRRRWLVDAGRLVAAFSAVYLPYFAWRYAYYGYFFPNTFYAKVGGGADFYLRGIKYIWLFISTYGFVPVAAASVYFYARMVNPRRQEADNKKLGMLLLLQIIFYLVFILLVGGDQLVMKRFFVPLLPALYLLSFRGAAELFSDAGSGGQDDTKLSPLLIAAVALSLVVTVLPSFVGRGRDRVFNAEKPADADRKIIGQWLKENVDPDATIALIPAGIIPYYSELRTIDLVGLNDERIAHTSVPGFGKGEAGHEKHNSAYVLERRPDLVFLGACRIWPQKFTADALHNYSWVYGRLAPGNREILQLDEFKENYGPSAARAGSGYLHFYKRKDFLWPLAEPVAASAEAERRP